MDRSSWSSAAWTATRLKPEPIRHRSSAIRKTSVMLSEVGPSEHAQCGRSEGRRDKGKREGGRRRGEKGWRRQRRGRERKKKELFWTSAFLTLSEFLVMVYVVCVLWTSRRFSNSLNGASSQFTSHYFANSKVDEHLGRLFGQLFEWHGHSHVWFFLSQVTHEPLPRVPQ